MKVIAFADEDGNVGVLTPTESELETRTLQQIATTDLPPQAAYIITEAEELPTAPLATWSLIDGRIIVGEVPAVPNWDGFNVWMLQETAFKELCSRAFQNGHGSMVSALFAAYRDVATGKTEPFEITFEAVCAAGGATPEHREAWAQQAAALHLPDGFVQILRGDEDNDP